jgi:hypothetical protein
MSTPRYPLYLRLPEIYRIRDVDQTLQHFLGIVEIAFGHLHENISQLYDDHFIETCADWVIPYIGDLVGTSHLAGDPHTLRADVADTVALRRRKGTLAAIELLTYSLTRWGVHAVELRERMLWHQHLNHQRPDVGGNPPYGLLPDTPPASVPRLPHRRLLPIRGGTITLRDPAMLSLLGGPFDPFAHSADPRPSAGDAIRYNLPNLAIFLWRLADYRVEVSQPVPRLPMGNNAAAIGAQAPCIARFFVHPMGEPMQLFNASRFDPDQRPFVIGELDHVPGPIPPPRLTTGAPAGNPDAYVAVNTYNAALPPPPAVTVGDQGLQLHVPVASFGAVNWTFRGANLCAWESGLGRPLDNFEIAIDPVLGRLAFGVPTAALANDLQSLLLVTATYGAVGPIGANPEDSREPAPTEWLGEPVNLRPVTFDPMANALQVALANLDTTVQPVVVEIGDSMTYDLDPATIAGSVIEGGVPVLPLNRSLIIRAREGERPLIRLAAPLRFRPARIVDPSPVVQAQLDAIMGRLGVRLEGLYLTRNAALVVADPNAPLIARAALNRLEFISSTLDPGGFRRPNGTREVIRTSLDLRDGCGFAPGSPEDIVFAQTPDIVIQKSIVGPLLIDFSYTLTIEDSIVDGGAGVADVLPAAFALAAAANAANSWGPPTTFRGATIFGRTRVSSMNGCGGIFVHALQVEDTQHGCIKQSYFEGSSVAGLTDRLPQNSACVTGTEAQLGFTAHTFGAPGYGQLLGNCDFRVRERGPDDDAMGATGFLLEARKWRNLQIRFAEFMPVGVRPLLIPVT